MDDETEYMFLERAAIKEFEGGINRILAEKQSCAEVYPNGCPHKTPHQEY